MKEKWAPPEIIGPLPGDFLLLPLPRGAFLPPLRSLYPVRASRGPPGPGPFVARGSVP